MQPTNVNKVQRHMHIMTQRRIKVKNLHEDYDPDELSPLRDDQMYGGLNSTYVYMGVRNPLIDLDEVRDLSESVVIHTNKINIELSVSDTSQWNWSCE